MKEMEKKKDKESKSFLGKQKSMTTSNINKITALLKVECALFPGTCALA